MNAVEQAQKVKKAVVKATGGWLEPKYMYVLGWKPKRQSDPPQMMSLGTHGWGDWKDMCEDFTIDQCKNEPYAELVTEEVEDYVVERVIEKLISEGVVLNWDRVQTAVVCFYNYEA